MGVGGGGAASYAHAAGRAAKYIVRSRFLKVFFKLLYHQLAWTYDWVAAIVSLGRWKSWVYAALPYLEGPRVLELGHGPGHLQVALLKRGVWAAGLDESRQMGWLALKKIRKGGFVPLLVSGYAQFTPFPQASFHQIVATFPSEYILDPAALAEISRILVPGGSLVVLPLAWITGRRPLDRLAAWLFRTTGQAPDWDDRSLTPLHNAGFQTRVHFQHHRSSTVLIILAHKPLR